MSRSVRVLFAGALALLGAASGMLMAACGSSATTPPSGPDAAVIDASTSTLDARPPVEAGADTGPDANDAGCVGACATLALEATYGAKTAKFERAQFGWDKANGRVTGVTTEVHAGGAPECPKQSSPTPDRTLVVSGVPLGSAGRVLTQADGVAVTLLDFKALLTSKPLDKATQVKLTVVALEGDAPERAAFDLEATFAEGKIVGHVFAEHCTTMDE